MSEGQLLIDISRRAMAWPVQVDPCGFAGQLALELLFSVQSGRGAVRIAPLREESRREGFSRLQPSLTMKLALGAAPKGAAIALKCLRQIGHF